MMPSWSSIFFVLFVTLFGCQTPPAEPDAAPSKPVETVQKDPEPEPQIVEELVRAPEKFAFYSDWPEGWHPRARGHVVEKRPFIDVSDRASSATPAEDTLVTAVVYCAPDTPDCESMMAFVDEARKRHDWLRVVLISDESTRSIHANGIPIMGHRPLAFHRVIRAQAIEAAALHRETKLVGEALYKAMYEKNRKIFDDRAADAQATRDACITDGKTSACMEIVRGHAGHYDWLAPIGDEADLKFAAKNACEKGEMTGCTVQEELRSEDALDLETYQEHCEKGSAYACWRVSALTLNKVPAEQWSPLARKACEAGYGCKIYALSVLKDDDTEAGGGPLLESACRAGDATSCAVAAIYRPQDASRFIMLALAKLDGPEEIRTVSLAALTATLSEKEREWLEIHEAYAPLMPAR